MLLSAGEIFVGNDTWLTWFALIANAVAVSILLHTKDDVNGSK